MSTQFQLPCPGCSRKLLVKASQAGETVVCECSQQVVVPTLRRLRQLETFEANAPASPSGDWDIRRGFLFVGGALLVAMEALTTWRILPQRQQLDTRAPQFKELDFDVQLLSPTQAYEAWQFFRRQKLDYRSTPEFLENRARHRELSGYLYAGWTVGGLGLLLILASLIWRPGLGSPRPG